MRAHVPSPQAGWEGRHAASPAYLLGLSVWCRATQALVSELQAQ